MSEEFTVSRHDWELLVQRVAKLEQAGAAQKHTTEIAVADEGKQVAKAKRGHRLPEGWVPGIETIEKMAAELHVSQQYLGVEHRKFCDYFYAVPGQKGVKLDWDRTWCNWMRNASERGSLRTNGSYRPNDDKIRDLMEMEIHAEGE